MVLYNHSSNVGETFANGGLFTIKNSASLFIFTDSATCAAGKNYEEIVLDKGGKLFIRGGEYFALGNAMTLNDALDIDTHLAFGKNTDTNAGSLVVNADNTWKDTAFLVSKSHNDNKPSSSYGKIAIGDNVSLTARGIAFATGKAAQFEIDLGNGSVLTFDEFIVADIAGYGLVGGNTIVISGFAEKSLAINKHNPLADDALAYMQISGVDSSKLSWAFDTATNKYWLTVGPRTRRMGGNLRRVGFGLCNLSPPQVRQNFKFSNRQTARRGGFFVHRKAGTNSNYLLAPSLALHQYAQYFPRGSEKLFQLII